MRVPIILLAAALAAGIADTAGTASTEAKGNHQQAYIKSSGRMERLSEIPAARLYTSLDKEKGKYTEKIKALLDQLLSGLHAAH
ncbi:hypothetical protein R70723_18575 [Paenibacillus sp. FSL R7-0273]|uniref:hypothetical protein n=1 Tax=Paenibacillus sp. FSL R7-0273 TaxID=1536772 RepID=UPI0004F6FA26|nr:hypothetical protein [Paenibacillus sp. FSL R7-0273]AIQ47675.1 hypothetical protein R70723_18575 [Paenibacillus sp. FSL R7-0273]OMF95766.1 hypothetical protein BK144_04050 [Paenibacillus sp. FSL R7-0273]